MAETRIDVQVEHKHQPADEEKHPNTCPSCGSHYRDDELAVALYVCTHCGHHFPMPAWARVEWLGDDGPDRDRSQRLDGRRWSFERRARCFEGG